MVEAFVFGKFLPFHKGHEAMIRFALSHCDHLTALVCCSDKEAIPAAVRVRWIEQTFPQESRLTVSALEYLEDELPNTSESSQEVSKVWSEVFKKRLPKANLLVTSEPYGDFVAQYMKIRYLPFDLDRRMVPVSSSAIRSELFTFWKYLPDSVKPDYAIKVAVSGTESTGKSVLAKRLADHFHGTLVREAGRELIPNSNEFTLQDLENVARAHTQRIRASMFGDSPLLFLDTTILTTISYGHFFFNTTLEVTEDMLELNRPHLSLYLTKEAPFVQDGTRLTEALRNALDQSHRDVWRAQQIPFIEISGNWEERFEKAKAAVNAFFPSIGSPGA